MLQEKIICDRCETVISDSSDSSNNYEIVFDALFNVKNKSNCGYAEINIFTRHRTKVKTIHLCSDCYDIAVAALNNGFTDKPPFTDPVKE